MTSRSSGSLQDEINFLTDLIQSHKRATLPKQRKHVKKSKLKWNPSMLHHPSQRSSRSRTGNMVYRPSNIHATQKQDNLPSHSPLTRHVNVSGTTCSSVASARTSSRTYQPSSQVSFKPSQFKFSQTSTKPPQQRHSQVPTRPSSAQLKPSQISFPHRASSSKTSPQLKPSQPKSTRPSRHPLMRHSAQRVVVDFEVAMPSPPVATPSSATPSVHVSGGGGGGGGGGGDGDGTASAKKKKSKSVKRLKKKLPKRKQLKWRRRSSDKAGSTTVDSSQATPAPALIATPTSSLTVRKKVSHLSRYKWKRRKSSTSSPLQGSTPLRSTKKRKRTHHTYKKTAGHSSFKNKVWIPSASGDSSTPGLVGHEKKTKQGNKQWVVEGLKRTPRRSAPKRGINSRSKKVVSMEGGRYAVDFSGRRMKRLSSSLMSGASSSSLSPVVSGYLDTARTSSVKRMMASRVVRRSKAYVWHAKRKKSLDKSKQFCLFYNRFGKCMKGKDCPYIHDDDKIAVCTRFLKGTCDKMNGTCPFSHKISKEKMPVCSFFLRGVCTRDDCPYLHVSVGRDAGVCPDFIKGYCPKGIECTLQHTLDCPKFSLTGSCPDGAKCPLRHNTKHHHRLKQATVSLIKEPYAFKKIRRRQEAMMAGRKGPGDGEGGNSEEGRETDVTITIRELDFMPLDPNAALDFIPL